MSIQLPRSPRSLHFTGSVKALGQDWPAPTHGQHRSGAPPPAPSVRGYEAPVPIAEPVTLRGRLASFDDDLDTQSLDRSEIEAALFPVAKRATASAPPLLPVPHFRTAEEARQHHAPPAVIVRAPSRGGSLPLGVWIAIAVIAGVVSYNLAPQAARTVTATVAAPR